jgi:glycosyltransferase involved in cell wall biosynthesis
MHVCVLVNTLAPAGAETVVCNLIEGSPADIEYTVCYQWGDDELADRLRAAGATVVALESRFQYDPAALYRFYRVCRCRDIDIVHAHLPSSHWVARLCSRLAGVETRISTHHNRAANYSRFARTLERLTRPLDTATVAVSEGVRETFDGDDWQVIHNGMDVTGFGEAVAGADTTDLRQQWDVAEDAVVLLNVARYSPQKRQQDAIDAVAATDLPVHLLLVGWGDREASLRARIEERGVGDRVTVTGRVPAVEPYYALADVFVSPSIREGLPMTLLEAMAASLPIVATEIPGVTEVVVDGETGQLVTPREPAAMARALGDMMDGDRRQALGQAGYRRARERFSTARMVERHLELYREVTAEP